MTTGTRRPVQPDDLYRFVTVPDAQIAPDGSRVAYVLNRIDADADEYRSAVWLIGAEDGEAAQFTAGEKRDVSPRWSPDGSRLAFLSDRMGRPQIYVMAAGGGEARRITDLADGAGVPVWSPDGSQIAFAADVQRELAPDDAKAKEQWAQRPRHVDFALYKRDGAGYTWDKRSHIFVVPADGGDARQITDGAFDDRDPAWSADGQTIAFCSARHAGRELDTIVDLYLAPATGGESRSIGRLGRLCAPAFAPDGRHVAVYATTDTGQDWSAHYHVWLVPVDGGAARNLMPDFDRSAAVQAPPNVTPRPAWTPDGARIAFAASDSGNAVLHVVNVADGGRAAVTSGDRQVGAWSLAPAASRLGFVFTDLDTPADVAVIGLDGSGERRLTRVNAALLDEIDYRPPQRRRFTTPHGEIDGWVMRHADADAPGPLLVDIHGGPHSFWGNVFPLNPFYWLVAASRGWTVLAVNPTGSGSYGHDFAYGLVGRWGEHDLPEQMAAVDALIAEGIADPERLAVTGYSYGGYMTSWVVGHTDRFKAAVIGAPVTNLESFHGTSDIGMGFGPFEMGGALIENREVFRRLSPITYIDQVTTPCLVVHGEADDRCPIGQGEEWLIGLRVQGKTAEMVRYPGGSHGFRGAGRPSHRADVAARLIDWIERFALHRKAESREAVAASD